jgi:hypothetical protein
VAVLLHTWNRAAAIIMLYFAFSLGLSLSSSPFSVLFPQLLAANRRKSN